MQPRKYKMQRNPGLVGPFVNTFNHFIGAVISYNFGSYLLVPFRHFAFSCFKHALCLRTTGVVQACNHFLKYKNSNLRDCSRYSEPEILRLLFRMPRFRDWVYIFRDASFSIDHCMPLMGNGTLKAK